MEDDMKDLDYVKNINKCISLSKYCKDLESNPSKKHVHIIAKLANDIPATFLDLATKFWIIPVVTFLQNDSISKDVKEELVKAMRVIIQKITLTDFQYFLEIYTSLIQLLFDKKQPNKVIMSHEELKEVVILCIKDLVHHSLIRVKKELYLKKIVVGQGLFFCLTIAQTEKSSAIRLAAIKAIMTLCHIDDETNKSDVFVQEMVADSLLEFLPGTVSGLQNIAMRTDVQNHKVTMMAVQAWGRYISLIFHDKKEEDVAIETFPKKDASTDISHTSIFNPKCDTRNYLRKSKRNREWLDLAAIKLGDCIEPFLAKIRSHSHYKVRRELVESIDLILKNCPRNMRPNIVILIDHIISLSEDESAEVSKKARNVLCTVDKDYMELLKDKFLNLLKRLSGDVLKCSDNEQLAILNQFAGYLRLFREQRLPNMEDCIEKSFLALASIMTIDCSNVPLLQTRNVKDLDDPAHFYGSDLWRQFEFVENNSCKEKLVVICKLLRELGICKKLIDKIVDLVSSNPKYRNELTLLLNWIFASVKDSSILDLYKKIVDFYTQPEIWYLPIEVNENTPLVQARSNIVQCCLLTEGLGHIAQNLQNNDYMYVFIRQTLYLIVERAGSNNGLISYIGVRTLETIAEVQNETISDLLCTNMDYLSFDVLLKLKKINSNPSVLDVIEVVTKYSKTNFLPHLRGIVEDVLKQMNTPYFQNYYSFLKIFYTFVVCIKMLMEKKNYKATKEETTSVPNSCSETIILSLLEYYNAKKIDEKIGDDFGETGSNTDAPNIELSEETNNNYLDDEENKKLPIHITIIVKIMKRCLHYLPLKNVQKSLMAMQTLQEGLLLLDEWENELLPIVHELWHPLTDRFKDENVLVINHAWQLLYVLATVSNDFIRSRTLRQVLPPVFKFLNESSKKSVDKTSIDMYKFTQTYKLQHQLLSTFGLIARLLKLHEKDLWQILSNTQMYLDTHQHPTLQACCVTLYKDIADYNGDVVWTKCLGIWNSKVARIPADATFKIESVLNAAAASPNRYRKNVQNIIKYIEEKNAMLN